MYAILSSGVLIALCDKPRYIKKNKASGAYIEATETEAIGISVSGSLYNLPGGDAIPDAPEAVVTQSEAAEYVFRNRVRIEENEAVQGAAIISMEDALCEQDAANDMRVSAIEDAICELDSSINGGVKTDE